MEPSRVAEQDVGGETGGQGDAAQPAIAVTGQKSIPRRARTPWS
jgi:hypothetical protein